MQLTHARQSIPDGWTLSDYRDQIIREIDGVALRVGALLRAAKARNPDHFNEWVERDLPFGLETARRLMGISAAYEKLPTEKLRLLPRPWQAMYALKALPSAVIEAGKAGISLEAFLRIWVLRGSQGLLAAWLKENERGGYPNETPGQRGSRERVAVAVPGIAARPQAKQMEVFDVIARRVG
jgi:hypothetical protein